LVCVDWDGRKATSWSAGSSGLLRHFRAIYSKRSLIGTDGVPLFLEELTKAVLETAVTGN